ncbi:MAG TPA: ABC transporter permease [Planctomycetota bacterium]|nr:ABC transporter permease [Planctomycetota bacterium]
MVARIVAESLRRRPRAKLAVVASVALGAGAAGGLVMLFLHVGDLLGEELRRFDANIEIFDPSGEIELSRLEALRGEECRWRHQIRRVTPELRAEVDGIVLLGRDPDPSWRIEGRPGVLAGVSLGWGPGDRVVVGGRTLEVTGTVATGGPEDAAVVVPLPRAQEILGRPGKATRVLVSALVTPDTERFRLFESRAKAFSDREVERFLCTPFAVNVARDFAAAVDAQARVIRRVAEAEGALLEKVDAALWALAASAVAAAALSVLAAMTAAVWERRHEVGLLKALGATNGTVAGIFLAEALVLALAGSALGWLVAAGASQAMSRALFGSAPPASGALYLVTLAASLLIVGLGTAWPLRRLLSLEPVRVLHEV